MNTKDHGKSVDMQREEVVIPTYIPYAADKNPVFYENRSYQGASGRVYPLPVTDRLSHQKTDKRYDSITLENNYIKIMVLPEIGGRIHIGLDKTNGYNFIYHNQVIKPALIGIAGPWISGGIEFNWPQHHRPTTFMPVDAVMQENEDGSKTVWVGETEPLYHLKSMAGITVMPGKSLLKVNVRAYNGTPFAQPFMWWANLGVHVNDNYQVTFPPDVKYVAFHDRATIMEWPMFRDRFSVSDEPVDGTWFKNHANAGSFMVMDGASKYNFVEGYDMAKQAGVVHVANHHISSGKKLFTWGNSESGNAWKNNLTDEDGHYVELMTGVYTDNQPDFSWMQPHETREFTQCWFPIRKIGTVKNATEDAAVSFDVSDEKIKFGCHATELYKAARILVKADDAILFDKVLDIDPETPFTGEVPNASHCDAWNMQIALYDGNGKVLVSYRPEKPEPVIMPAARVPAPDVTDIQQVEELYIHGLHIDQYRHHTIHAEDYYLQGLKLDPADIRCNNAMGLSLMKKGLFDEAEAYFKKALARLMSRNTNPYDSEPLFNLATAQKFNGKYDEAYNGFYKAAWSYAFKSASYYALAELGCMKNELEQALLHVKQSLVTNANNTRGRNLLSAILRHLGRPGEAIQLARETLQMDVLDHWARFELYFALQDEGKSNNSRIQLDEIAKIMIGKAESYLGVALEYASAGLGRDSMAVLQTYLQSCPDGQAFPVAYYLAGWLTHQLGDDAAALKYCIQGERSCHDYCFVNRLEYIAVLQFAFKINPSGAKALYHLGNLYYDKQRYDDAQECWEKSRALEPSFATVHRNLAYKYFEKDRAIKKTVESMEKAFSCDPADSRLLFELLQVYKNSNLVSPEKRLALLDADPELVEKRNACYIERIILLLQMGRLDDALERIESHEYDIYEGGEGKLVYIHEWICILKCIESLKAGNPQQAMAYMQKAMTLPANYHEGRHAYSGTNLVHYFSGMAAEQAGLKEQALYHYNEGTKHVVRPGEAIFYQALSFSKLGDADKAIKTLELLGDEGQKLVDAAGRKNFFAMGVPTSPPFENDRMKRNTCDGLYMIALSNMGIGKLEDAEKAFEQIFSMNSSHLGSWIHTGRSSPMIKKYLSLEQGL